MATLLKSQNQCKPNSSLHATKMSSVIHLCPPPPRDKILYVDYDICPIFKVKNKNKQCCNS